MLFLGRRPAGSPPSTTSEAPQARSWAVVEIYAYSSLTA
jgi:hypothetical protein